MTRTSSVNNSCRCPRYYRESARSSNVALHSECVVRTFGKWQLVCGPAVPGCRVRRPIERYAAGAMGGLSALVFRRSARRSVPGCGDRRLIWRFRRHEVRKTRDNHVPIQTRATRLPGNRPILALENPSANTLGSRLADPHTTIPTSLRSNRRQDHEHTPNNHQPTNSSPPTEGRRHGKTQSC